MTFITDSRHPCAAAEATVIRSDLGRLLFRIRQTAAVWYDRYRQRRHLAALDDHLLRDIGIDRLSARKEASKPFWL